MSDERDAAAAAEAISSMQQCWMWSVAAAGVLENCYSRAASCLSNSSNDGLPSHTVTHTSADVETDTDVEAYSENYCLGLAASRFQLNTSDRHDFSAAGPKAWNSLPDFIQDTMSSTGGVYSECTCSCDTRASRALGILNDNALPIYKSTHSLTLCLQCFDAVGWAAGRASGL